MKASSVVIRHQILLIEEAMKEAGIWSNEVPEWVQRYQGNGIPDFWQWLQFVYLPMRAEGAVYTQGYLALQVKPYLDDVIHENSKLVQRIVELDSLSRSLSKI